MKKQHFFPLFIALMATLLACENKSATTDKTAETTTAVTADSEKTTALKAKFVSFTLGDAAHFEFDDASGKHWDFADCRDTTVNFAIELPSKEANSENQGWGAAKELQGKWFDLEYKMVEMPEYPDGPMANLPVIVTAKAAK